MNINNIFFSAFPGIFGTQQDTYIQVIKEMLVTCIQPPNADKVRLLSARAACAFITECLGESKYKSFAELYPGILEVRFAINNNFWGKQLNFFIENTKGPKLYV